MATVVAFHAGWGLFSGGFVGVDVFFVLSGFLITGLLVDELVRSGRVSFGNFYGRRARRLLPASTLVLIVVAVAFAAVLSPLDRPSLAADLRAAAAYLANWHFAASSLNYMSSPDRSPVLHFWSLAVEEQFYFVWPLLLVLAGARAARRGDTAGCRRRIAIALGLVLVLSLALSIWQTPRSEPYAYYGLHTRAWELAAGGLVALVPAHAVRRTPRWMRGVAGWMGLILVLLAATRFDSRTVFPGIAAGVPVAGTVLLVAVGLDGADVGARWLLSARPLRYVGRVSYSWYLWHWPALVLVADLTVGVATPDDGGQVPSPPLAGTLAAIAVSFLLAVVTHHLVEDPVRRARWLAAARSRSLALAATLTTASVGLATAVLPAGATAPSTATVSVVAAATPSGTSTLAAPTSRQATRVRLNESPAKARDDKPLDNKGCYPLYDDTSVATDCEFGDPNGTKTIVLLGDSHAQQWREALARQAKAHHWKLYMWVKAECPFTDIRIWLPQFHGEYTGCRTWRAQVLKQLATLPHIDAILVSHASSYVVHVMDPKGNHLRPSQMGALWTAGWKSMATELTSLASQVAVIRDVPRPRLDVPACLAAHHADASRCSPSRSDAYWAQNQLTSLENAAMVPHTSVIDLDPLICPGDPCPVVASDGTIMYRDQDHLTMTYSLRLAGALGRRVATLLAS